MQCTQCRGMMPCQKPPLMIIIVSYIILALPQENDANLTALRVINEVDQVQIGNAHGGNLLFAKAPVDTTSNITQGVTVQFPKLKRAIKKNRKKQNKTKTAKKPITKTKIKKKKKKKKTANKGKKQKNKKKNKSNGKMCWTVHTGKYIDYLDYYKRRIIRSLYTSKSIVNCKTLCVNMGTKLCQSFQYYAHKRHCILSTLKYSLAKKWRILKTKKTANFHSYDVCAANSGKKKKKKQKKQKTKGRSVSCGESFVKNVIKKREVRLYEDDGRFLFIQPNDDGSTSGSASGSGFGQFQDASDTITQRLFTSSTITMPTNTHDKYNDFDYYEFDTTTSDALNIVGGNIAEPGAWPWQVQISKFGRHHCGGSILGEKWILTAAHCFVSNFPMPVSEFEVVAGGSNKFFYENTQQKRRVVKLVKHTGYVDKWFDQDIALLELDEPFNFTSEYVRPVCIPKSHIDPKPGTKCYVTGYGHTKGTGGDQYLKQAIVPIMERSQCKTVLKFTNNMICAGYPQGGIDACEGDSGGPLVCNENDKWYQYGIVSFGEGCALKDKPGFYSRVTKYFKWVSENTGLEL